MATTFDPASRIPSTVRRRVDAADRALAVLDRDGHIRHMNDAAHLLLHANAVGLRFEAAFRVCEEHGYLQALLHAYQGRPSTDTFRCAPDKKKITLSFEPIPHPKTTETEWVVVRIHESRT